MDPVVIFRSKKLNWEFTNAMRHVLNVLWYIGWMTYLSRPPSEIYMYVFSINNNNLQLYLMKKSMSIEQKPIRDKHFDNVFKTLILKVIF